MANRPITDFAQNILKPYINNQDKAYAANIAPVETSPATSAHTAGTQIIYNGVLYDVTADIAANDALATTGAGANIAAADDVSEQISNVKQALTNEVTTRTKVGAHNLLPNFLSTKTESGITYTVNADKSITISGTATAPLSVGLTFRSGIANIPKQFLKNGNYILSGVTGGSDSTVSIALGVTRNGGYSAIVRNYTGDSPFTINGEDNYSDGACVQVQFDIASGANFTTPKTIYPMIRLASDPSSEYSPYAPTNAELLSCKDNGVLGAKNLLYMTLESLKSNNTDGTWSNNVYTYNDVTFTVNSDGTISTSGTASGAVTFDIYTFSTWEKYPLKFLSGCPSGGSLSNGYCVRAIRSAVFSKNDEGNGVLLDQDNTGSTTFRINVQSGTNMANLTFKPMIRLATDTDPTYQPYAMTNKELTDVAVQIEGKYVVDTYAKSQYIYVSSDGVKTYKTLLQELITAFISLAQSLPDGESIRPIGLSDENIGSLVQNGNSFIKMLDNSAGNVDGFPFMAVLKPSKLLFAQLHTTLSSNSFVKTEITTSGVTQTDYSDTIPASQSKLLKLWYEKDKKIL